MKKDNLTKSVKRILDEMVNFEPLKHALSSYKGLVERILSKIISKYCAKVLFHCSYDLDWIDTNSKLQNIQTLKH